MADISGFHTLINDGSHGQGDQSLKENFQDHEKRREKRCLFKLPDLGQKGFEHKKSPFFTVQKTALLERIPGAIEQIYCSATIIGEIIFNVKINMCEMLDTTSFKRYIKS